MSHEILQLDGDPNIVVRTMPDLFESSKVHLADLTSEAPGLPPGQPPKRLPGLPPGLPPVLELCRLYT